ncbi:MAG: MBOAT family protein [Lachnospiraceae bacterium]|nr:MBOAT family protein [Lachnospiraceae bacterium]
MLFSSMIFLWVFLPGVLIMNYAVNLIPAMNEEKRIRLKNRLLLLASLFFYAWGGIYYLLIMISSILINFTAGYVIHEKCRSKKAEKTTLVIAIVLNIAILFFFKYFNMLVIMLEALLASNHSLHTVIVNMLTMKGTGTLGIKEIVLPIGISFFTFQSMSYVCDVYLKKAPLQKNLLDFALYVSLFPQLIAGPIVKYSDIADALKNRKESASMFYEGQRRFCYGLGKKVLLANTFAETADTIFALEVSRIGTPLAWLGIVSYTLQIYYDFSGYSDMAIGIGKMLGFSFRENFNYPYTSLSIQEFWRRWHISLSAWFKEYVYIPLGGNRKGKRRTYLNLFVVFLLTGLWHGANFTFLFWGIYYGIFLIIERCFLGEWLKKNPIKPLNWIYTMLLVMIGWVYFRSDNIIAANAYIGQMFGGYSSNYMVLSLLSVKLLMALVIGILFSGFVQRPLQNKYHAIEKSMAVRLMDLGFQMIILCTSILVLVSGTYNPFLYFQF